MAIVSSHSISVFEIERNIAHSDRLSTINEQDMVEEERKNEQNGVPARREQNTLEPFATFNLTNQTYSRIVRVHLSDEPEQQEMM